MATCRFESSNAAVCSCLIDILERTRPGSTESLKCQVCSEAKALMCGSEACSHPVCMDCMNRILLSERGDIKCPTCRCEWIKIKTFIPLSHSMLSLIGTFEGNECPLCNSSVVSSPETTSFTAEQFQTHVLSSCSSITCPCRCETGKHNNMSGVSACFREFNEKFAEKVESRMEIVAASSRQEESRVTMSGAVDDFMRNVDSRRASQQSFRAGVFFVLQMIIMAIIVVVVYNIAKEIVSGFVRRCHENYVRQINY